MNKPGKQLELVPAQIDERPATELSATEVPPTETHALAVLEPQQVQSDDFDWSHDSHLVVAEQRAVAIYLNPAGDVVIRQQTRPDEDPFVVISPDNLISVIDALCDLAGIPEVGRGGFQILKVAEQSERDIIRQLVGSVVDGGRT